jgi:hypothetical protein
MADPLGVLSVSLVVATTEVEEDVDGRPPGGAGRSPVAATTEVEEDVDGGPPGECWPKSGSSHH